MKKQLKFDILEEFQQYVSENGIKFSDLEIFQIEKETIVEVAPVPKIVDIKLISLHDNPTFKAKLGESNILYVEDVQINEDCCMPAKINVMGRTVSVILCNQDGKTKASLNVAFNDVPMYDVPFEVRKLNGEEITMEIAKDMIERKA